MFRKIVYLTVFFVFCFSQLNAQKRVIIPPTEDYIKHLNAAKSHNLGLINSKSDLNKHVNRGNLVKVKQRGYGWRTADLTHSHPYLVPRANQALRDIAREFVKTTGQNFFVVTSLTRTINDQDKLRGINSNASSNNSAHNYGAAFDISYVRFNHHRAPNANLDQALHRILKSFENSGRLYFVKERQSKCYHIVVRR